MYVQIKFKSAIRTSNSKKSRRNLISMALTLAIIGLLVLSGPISAVIVNISSDKTTYTATDSSVVFTVDVDIESDERVPVQNLTLTISGTTSKNCVFDLAGNAISGCSNLTITPVNTQGYGNTSALFGYGYGYGYDGVYNTTNQTFDLTEPYGYGYGYTAGYGYNTATGGELRYQITWNLTAENPSDGSYSANLQAFAQLGSNWRVYTDQTPTTFTISRESFSFSGYTYDVGKTAVNGTNVTVKIYSFDGSGPPSLVSSSSVLSNSSGFFNVTNLPAISNYMFKPVVIKYNSSDSSRAEYVGQSLPHLPYTEFASVGSVNFYLKNATTVNVTAYVDGGTTKTFQYMIKDTSLGYPIKEQFGTYSSEVIAHLPADRNYSIQLFPNQSMVVHYTLDNITDYGNHPKIDLPLNVTEEYKWVSGFVKLDGNVGYDSLTIIPYSLESGNMVFETYPMPYNMSSWRSPQESDEYNVTTGSYNITLATSAVGTDIFLFANVKNGSTYYGGFKNVSLNTNSPEHQQINFTLEELVGTTTNISLDDFNSPSRTKNVTTLKKTFKLQNSTGSTPTNAHIEFELDYTSYGSMSFSYMADVSSSDSGVFTLPVLNKSVDKINVYTSDFAPLKTSLTLADLQPATTLINLTAFNPGGINETITDLKIGLYKSSSSCDVPYPSTSCLLTSSEQDLDDFNPLTVVMGGGDLSFRMRKNSNNITVHYVNVDLLASGPPNVAFDSNSSSSQSTNTVEEAWRFGSKGPEIYDYVLLGMPYNESNFDENGDFTARINLLYDDEWNVVWNISLNETSEVPSDYSDYLTDEYKAYLNSSVDPMSCSKTNTSATCYVNTTYNLVWMKIPHFSGVGPELDGERAGVGPTITVVSIGGDTSTDSSGYYSFSDPSPIFSLTTNEAATCRYAATNAAWGSMTAFSTTGGTSHSTTIGTQVVGSYTYYVRCRDGSGNEGTTSFKFTITSSGGGSGGAGVSSYTTGGVDIEAGSSVTITIGQSDEYGVTEVVIEVVDEAGNVILEVKKYDEKPSDIVEDLLDTVYRYLEITAENLDNSNIDSAKVRFKVEKSWLDENGLDPETVLLNRYSNSEWEGLETVMIDEDDTYYYYESSTSGFSYFAITAKEESEVEGPVCGNGICEEGETYQSCSSDCHKPTETPVCGNGVCETGENCGNCLKDCPCAEGYTCQDGVCKSSEEVKKEFPLRTVTIVVLMFVTLAVIFWLVQSLKEEQAPKKA